MSRPPSDQWESRVRQVARHLPYPPTPAFGGALAARPRGAPRFKPVWALLLILVLLAGLWATPPLRAAILEFLQIGGVRIWLVEATPLPADAPSAATPHRTPAPSSSLSDLVGATTLAEAEQRAGFRVRLPAHPPDLGAPDWVFYQEIGVPTLVLVWLAADDPDRPRFSLHILAEGAIVDKGAPTAVATTTVHGQPAAWTTGPYLLAYRDHAGPQWDLRRLVEGHVLVWSEQSLTYRLETDLPLEEAVRVAESLQ